MKLFGWMRRLKFIFFIVIGFPYASAAEEVETQSIKVNIKEHHRVLGNRVYLEDVATIDPNNNELGTNIAKVDLGKAPRVGAFRHIRATHIASIVEKTVPGSLEKIRWQGSSQVVVGRSGKLYDKSSYINAAKSVLDQHLSKYGSDIAVATNGIYKDMELPLGNIRFDADVVDKTRIRNRMAVWVDISVDSSHYRTVAVWFSVKAMGDVLVFEQSYKKGELLNRVKLRKVRGNTALTPDAVPNNMDLENQRLSRDVSKDSVVLYDQLEELPDVITGSEVNVMARVGNVQLRTKAIAVEEGSLGDSIQVVNRKDGFKYQVKVIGKNTVSADGEG